MRLDRDAVITGKSQGGGVCLYVNQRWCKNVTVRETVCTDDIELLSVSLRPHYLPREFPQIFLTVAYIHPKANAKNAVTTIQKVTQKLQSLSPDAPCFVLGDFNHCNLKSMNTFYQYVSCPTRLDKTIDLCYGAVNGAYKSIALPPLGSSDHNIILLIPTYKPLLKRGKTATKEVEMWTEDAIEELRGALECTEWDVFKHSSSTLDEMTEVISSYTLHLKNLIIPTKQVKVFPNNKPWLNKAVKDALHRKHNAFLHGDSKDKTEAKKEVRYEIKRAKLQYKSKIEGKFHSNDLRAVWDGMKAMTGQDKRKNSGSVTIDGFDSNSELANALNDFYLRFNDEHDFTKARCDILDSLNDITVNPQLTISAISVKHMFSKSNVRKSPGPDMITGKLLKVCADQLCDIYSDLFNLSLSQHKVPMPWKESIVVPVAKIKSPKELNDLRPVALTSIVMKTFERLVKQILIEKVQSQLDPMQFAYRASRGVDDATITLFNYLYKHLEGIKTHARLLFLDFSSAFNTIQPHILVNKLLSDFNLDAGLVKWVLDFLTCRPQVVRANDVFSQKRLSSTGSPQGRVLSPLLYILYTNDCKSKYTDRHLLKFADDTVLISLLQEGEVDHGPVLEDFVEWCDNHFLKLNVLKTKDMAIDFRKNSPSTLPTIIKGSQVETVEYYKYLGTVIDKNLNHDLNTSTICKKGLQRLYFLRRLNTFNVDKTLMVLFYKSFIESILTFCIISWYGNLTVQNKKCLSDIVKVASKIIGTQQLSLSDIYNRQVYRKAQSILASTDHPLLGELVLLPSGRRYRFPRVRSNRFKFSFIPSAINVLNLH